MIRVIATFLLQSEKVDEAIKMVTELVATTRTEQGCGQYDLIQSEEKSSCLVILEGWETQADLNAHSASEHFTRLVPLLAGMCVEPPSVKQYHQLL